LRDSTTIFNSDENQRSVTTFIGRVFPNTPAGMVIVRRMPSARTPEI
jgi:hypothetical protein